MNNKNGIILSKIIFANKLLISTKAFHKSLFVL